jgi:hypothetical protein
MECKLQNKDFFIEQPTYLNFITTSLHLKNCGNRRYCV